MTRILSLFVMFMLSGVMAFAQGRVVTGTVIDDKGTPIEGASVIVVGTRTGTATDVNGFYRLTVPAGGSIRVSGAGLGQQESVASGSNANFTITRNAGTELTTVVVTAIGVRRQPKELGYAVTTINNKTLTAGKSTGVAQSLNGKISGVSISTTNSGVFETPKIRIRGIHSLTGDNNPMLVVDGSEVPLSYLNSIAPEDIATTTLLKGATAAAIYGPNASAGVLLITTKRGSNEQGLSVAVTSSIQFTKVAFYPKLQHQFGQGAGEVINPDGSYGYVPYENQIYGPAFDGSIKDIGERLEDGTIQSGPYSNLHASDKKNFYNTGTTLQNNISLTGKDFFFSVDDAVIDGVVPDDKRRRSSFRFNASKSGSRLSSNFGVNYILDNTNVLNETALAGLSGTSYGGGLFFLILQTADNIPLLKYKDWQNNKYAQYSNYYNQYSINPYWAIGNLRTQQRTDRALVNFEVGYQMASWLKATVRANTSLTFQSVQNTTAPIIVSDFAHATRNATQYTSRNGSVSSANNTNAFLNFDAFLSGDHEFGKSFKLRYLGGGNIKDTRGKNVTAGGLNLVVPYLYNPSVRSGELTGSSSISETNSYALYGSLGLGYKGFAFIEGTARNEWDSRLLPDNRVFFYPGVNGSLVLADGTGSAAFPALQNRIINYAKIRGSYAKSGQINGSIGAYQLDPTYGPIGGFPFNNNVGFTANNFTPDPNLTPEFQYTSEVGFDLGLLPRNRIYIEATYYNSDNQRQILDISRPNSTGYTLARANAARFRNYGAEFDLSLNPLVNIGKARVDLKFNAGYNNNKVLETFQNLPVISGGSGNFIQNSASSPTINQYLQVGGPAYQYQLTDYNRDPEGHVIVDANGLPSQAAALLVTGRSLPKWIFGVTPSVAIGNFAMSFTMDYKSGHNAYSGLGSDMDFSGVSARSAQYNRQNFVFPNSVYEDPIGSGKYVQNTNRLTQDGNYAFWTGKSTNSGIATNYFYSANALRLREVNLSYTQPFSGKGLKSLTFSIVGRNLLLFVPDSNQWGDPEFNSGGENTYGISSSFQSPATRLMGFSVKAQF